MPLFKDPNAGPGGTNGVMKVKGVYVIVTFCIAVLLLLSFVSFSLFFSLSL